MPDTPPALLATALRRDPAGPLITYYDDAAGERTEVSATTFANWVAKTANLLRDELDVEAGSPVCVLLPAHWQTAVVLFALWSLGASPATAAAGVDLVITGEASLPAARQAALQAGAGHVLALSLRPMNRPLREHTAGVVDYAAEVLSAGDDFAVIEPTGHDAAAAARLRAAQVGLSAGERVLVSQAVGVPDVVDWLLMPLAAPASIVLCGNADLQQLGRRATDERVTATLGLTVEGVRRLDS